MASHDPNLLVRQFEAYEPLPDDDRAALLALPVTRRALPATAYLMREGDAPRYCPLLIDGYVVRHKLLSDGGRQIVSLHLPGELLDRASLYLHRADHNIQALTQVEVALVPVAALRQLVDQRPALARAMLLAMMIEASMLREWMTRIGRRDARARLAHLLCEFACRIDARGQRSAGGYELPLTQEQLGDALGLTAVHINRSMKALVDQGLVIRTKRVIGLPDIEGLRRVADFSDVYLHMDQRADVR